MELNTVYVKFSVGPEKLSENFSKLFSASARETVGPTISSTHPEFIFIEEHKDTHGVISLNLLLYSVCSPLCFGFKDDNLLLGLV